MKQIFESINENKEEVKIKIAKVFTTIRNSINEREDELLLEVDSQFNNLFFKEEIVNKSEKLPNEIKLSLEKGKLINNEWNNNDSDKLNLLINDCINIENNIKSIKTINESIEKYNSSKIIVDFINEENSIMKEIKNFGKIISQGEEILKFKSLLKDSFEEYKNKNIDLELIYDASKDGQNYSNCHSKCNNVPTLFPL